MSNQQEMTDRIDRARKAQSEAWQAVHSAKEEVRRALLAEAEMLLAEARKACTCDARAHRYDIGCRIADEIARVESLGGSR